MAQKSEQKGSSSRMAKAAAVPAPNEGLGERLKAWPQRIKAFYTDVRTEMKKVTTPTRKEVQSTTVVVIVTVFLFGLFFWIVDTVFGHTIDTVLRYFTTH